MIKRLLVLGFLMSAASSWAAITTPSTSSGSYTVSFTNPSAIATSYTLLESTNGGSTWTRYSLGTARSKSISNKAAGTYTYDVEYCAPIIIWGNSYTVCLLTSAIGTLSWPYGVTTVVPAPNTPSGITGPSSNYSGSYSLNWGASSGASTYQLQEKVNSGSWVTRQNTSSRSRSFSGKTNATYYYRVRACSGACSGWTGTKSVQVIRTPGVPGVISGPSSDSDGAFSLAWGAASGSVSRYELWRRVDGGSWSRIQNTNTLSRAESGRTAGTWGYRVRACNSLSCGSYTATKNVVVAIAPSVPQNVSGPANDTDGTYSITWTASSGSVTSYTVQEQENGGGWSTIGSPTTASFDVSGKSTGTYTYQVNACNSICSSYSSTVTVLVDTSNANSSPNPNTPPAIQVASQPSTDPISDAVGVTAGSFRVDESGAATYSIPILAAPGIAGVAPQISLNYSNQAGNGIVGQGWALGGMSAITRCRQSIETDGQMYPVTFSTNDRYCLDGARLIEIVSGTNPEYRTEIDQIARIRAYGASDGDPDYFRVWRKDGSVSVYGATTDSRAEPPGRTDGKASSWAQNEFADSVGNSVSFSYIEDGSTGEHLIDEITWADGDADIGFTYETRSDTRSGYANGSGFDVTRRLKTIESRNRFNGQLSELRTYTLGYQYAAQTGFSQVTSITECNGSVCYPATTIDWAGPASGVGNSGTFSHQNGFAGGRAADLNGDGINEFIWLSVDGNSQSYIQMMYLSSSGSMVVVPITQFNQQLRGNVSDSWTIIDYNNDGRQDIMYQEGTEWKVRLGLAGSTPSFGTEMPVGTAGGNPKHSLVVDVHGDGLPDIAYLSSTMNIQKLTRTGSGSTPYTFATALGISGIPDHSQSPTAGVLLSQVRPMVADFNGDGVVDFVVREEVILGCGQSGCPTIEQWAAYESRGMNAQGLQEYALLTTLDGTILEERLRVADINADGLTDLAYQDSANSWVYQINNGDGFNTTISLGTYTAIEARRSQFLDYDRDGDADFMYPSGNYWYVKEWTGAAFSSNGIATTYWTKSSGSSSPGNWHTSFVDLNGDGKLDQIYGDDRDHSGSNTALFRLSVNAFSPDGVVTSITNGFGATTNIDYKMTTDPSEPALYVPQGDANTKSWGSPVFDLNGPMWVVNSVESSAPAAGPNPGSVNYAAKSSISYQYTGFKSQAGGRGSLGFETITSIDDQTQIETTTTYRQDFPYIGRPIETVVQTGSGAILSSATNVWGDAAPSSSPIFQPYLSSSVEIAYPTTTTNTATGAFTRGSNPISTTTTTMTMDASHGNYGDVDQIVVDVDAGGTRYIKTTTNTYLAPDLTDWHLGRLQQATVVHDRRDNSLPTVTRVSAFTYNSTTGLLASETIEPNGGQSQALTTTYVHDSVGNVIETLQTGYRGPQLPGETEPTTVTRSGETHFDADGRFATSSENYYGHTASIVERNKYGAVTEAQDANNQPALTEYGAMGRQYWSADNVGGFGQTVHRLCQNVSCPTGAVFRVYSTSAGGSESYGYFDVLGREVRSATRTFDGGWSIALKEYDELGRVVHSSEPFSSSSPSTGVASYWTEITYDDLGRVTHSRLPDNSTGTIAYAGLTTTYTDGLSKQRVELKNALGELVRATDHDSGFVDYTYDEQGNVASSTQGGPGATSVVANMGYDILGRKISMTDADMGSWSYEYNTFGELVRQFNAQGDRTDMSYDRLGRMVRRIDYLNTGGGNLSEQSDSGWIFDTASAKNSAGTSVGSVLGGLFMEYTEVAGTTPVSRTFTYDEYRRARDVTTEIRRGGSTETYTQSTTYDQFGRVFQAFDGAAPGSGTEHYYNNFGYLEHVDEAMYSASTQKTYYTVTNMDQRGNVTMMDQGGMSISRTFDAQTGRLEELTALDTLSQTVQDLTLDWDVAGNLTSKEDLSQAESGGLKNILETYFYDNLHRLDLVRQNGTETLDMQYDALGNISSKQASTAAGSTDSNASVTGYAYASGTHRLSQVSGASYAYNANGSMLTGDGRVLTWGVHNKPTAITRSGRSVHLYYGPGRSRYQRIDDINQSGETTTHYVGGIEKIWRPGNVVVTKRYVGGEAVVTYTDTNGTQSETDHYVLKDHLGSTHLLTDVSGNIVQAMSFDAFGSRRTDNVFASMTDSLISMFDTDITTRGFTGHEGLDAVGLVHMNGRVHDPRIGRFVSADPFVQSPGNTQSLNRYAYVWNNPLRTTDPSGHFLAAAFGAFQALPIPAQVYLGIKLTNNSYKQLTPAAQQGVGVIATAVSAVYCGPCSIGVAATAQAHSSYAQGGNLGFALRQGAIAGASAAAFYGIGEAFSSLQVADGTTGALGTDFSGPVLAQKAVLHGVVGGVFNTLQGGKFGHGFLSAAVSQVSAGVTGSFEYYPSRIVASAIVGGTVSAATGGKFANGAATAAFARILNDEMKAHKFKPKFSFKILGERLLGAGVNEEGDVLAMLKAGKGGKLEYNVDSGKLKGSIGDVSLATDVSAIANEFGLKTGAFTLTVGNTSEGNLVFSIQAGGKIRGTELKGGISYEVDIERVIYESEVGKKIQSHNRRNSDAHNTARCMVLPGTC